MAMATVYSDLIHGTAVIDHEAILASDVQVGAYAVIEGPVEVGPGCVIESHACLSGPLRMGRDNFVGHGAVLGKSPQHRGYQGEPTSLEIGDGNIFRELVTVHRGTTQGNGVTTVGDRNLLMCNSHLGHDVQMGDGCTVVNNALIAGHVAIANDCILGGNAAVQQRVRIGRLAMLGGMSSTTKDIPPFVLQQGYNCVTSLNLVGLRRAGVPMASINALRQTFRILYREGLPISSALDRVEQEFGEIAEVAEVIEFIRTSKLGVNPARASDRSNYDIQ